MARVAAQTTVAKVDNTNLHTAALTTAGSETGNVYVSYDASVITSYSQLVGAINAALRAMTGGPLKANS